MTLFPFPVSFFFLSPFSYCVLFQQSPVLSIYIFFSHSSPTLFMSLLTQSPHRNFGLPCLHFPSNFWAPALFASLSSPNFFHMTNPCTPHQFLLSTFLHSIPYSHLIHFLLSALLAPMIILTRLFFRNPGPSVVSLLVPSSPVHSCMPG